MIKSFYKTTLDVHEVQSQCTFNIKRGDNARNFYFSFTEEGMPYAIADNCTAVLRAKKPDGTVLYNTCEIMDGSVVKYQLTNQTSATPGIVKCEIQILDIAGNQITSPRFELYVDDTIYSDSEIESEDEFTELTRAITETNNLNIVASRGSGYVNVFITDKYGETKSVKVYDGPKGDPGDPKVFVAEYDVTPFEGIQEAARMGMACFCLYDDGSGNGCRTYELSNITGSTATFSTPFNATTVDYAMFRQAKVTSAGVWSHETVKIKRY